MRPAPHPAFRESPFTRASDQSPTNKRKKSTMTAASTRTIAVYGATGHQGGAVIDALLARGIPAERIRALVRDPNSQKSLAIASRGISIAHADVDDPRTLPSALGGIDALFFMTVPPGGIETEDTEGESRQGIALAEAAVAARVPHVVFSSVGGAERHSGVPHFESKRRVEEVLEESGLRTTIIRPVFFFENLAYMLPQVEDGELVLRLPIPDGITVQMIAVRDIGVVSAIALVGDEDLPAAIEIAGDERTGSEAAAFGAHAGLPARYEAVPVEAIGSQGDLQAMFRWFADTPAYQADPDEVRSIHPDLWDLPAWLNATGYAPGT
jgi:uncharacterized protein YbjT (DUF2867 family)